ncbi:High cysteine membrane protein VSP-like [Giardia lamblia P15]|uniref:High cysteine membrane protein VSP-like n=1 Tax=Giardia intestinalis (strain P15) TaxID=658858 RepID=E1F044_GIAIA|nr:High cysteine membrane protein VSP-like [Giardia lamblia P15]
MTLASLVLILTYLLGVFSSDGESIYHNGFGYPCEDEKSNCLQNRCLRDLSTLFCTECASTHVPINGRCTPAGDARVTTAGCVKSSQGGWCTECGNNYFLFYGGCYELDEKWQTSICHRAENGVCKECGKGSEKYTQIVFTNPNATSPERCIYCGDVVGFGGYNGVYNCQHCSQPRLPEKTVPDCNECAEGTMCPFDYQCKPADEMAEFGYCEYCPKTHIGTEYACYAIGSITGNSVCLPSNIIEVQNRSLCTQCVNSSEVPRNGRCLSINKITDACTKDSKTGKCVSCKTSDEVKYFLFYGGCYAIEEEVMDQIGSHICQTVQDNVCTACNNSAEEVFTKNNRCWRCGDTANGGIAGCQRCETKGDALQCLECRDLYLSLDKKSCLAGCPRGQRGIQDSSSKSFICACDDGFYLKDGGCVKCAAENCAKCDEAKCSKCRYGYTLSDDQCAETKCKDPNCDTCENRDVCTRCSNDHSLDQNGLCVKDCLSSAGYYKATVGDVSRCVACTLGGCAVCESADRCTTCRDGFYPNGSGGCKACNPACATCSGPEAGDCTSCPAKKRLQYSDGTKGSCVPQCVKDGSCAECGLTIDGTSYCSRCTKGTEYPNNGVCASAGFRTVTSRCLNIANGQCALCDTDSFKLNGGCYTSKLLPGKTVCTKESNGWCDSITSGYEITYNGMLLTCPKNCAVCSGGICSVCNNGFYPERGACRACSKGCATCPHGKACFDCLAGYYFSENVCKACHEAIPKCSLCTVPEGATQPVCLEYGYVSRLAISTRAISGIIISVVLIIGIVAAVLVWLFIFRKKNKVSPLYNQSILLNTQ